VLLSVRQTPGIMRGVRCRYSGRKNSESYREYTDEGYDALPFLYGKLRLLDSFKLLLLHSDDRVSDCQVRKSEKYNRPSGG
jgi:hypothetical protein